MFMRWGELGSQRRQEVAGKIGGGDSLGVEEIGEDLRALAGGLGYL